MWHLDVLEHHRGDDQQRRFGNGRRHGKHDYSGDLRWVYWLHDADGYGTDLGVDRGDAGQCVHCHKRYAAVYGYGNLYR